MAETIIVDRVEGPNENGWYSVALVDDTRELTTQDAKVAQVANQSKGQEIEAVINEVKRGKFTNHYLNKIGDVGSDTPPSKRGNGGGKRSFTTTRQDADATRQERIARQWAFGRSVELLTLADVTVDLKGLTSEQKKFLQDTASFLLGETK